MNNPVVRQPEPALQFGRLLVWTRTDGRWFIWDPVSMVARGGPYRTSQEACTAAEKLRAQFPVSQ